MSRRPLLIVSRYSIDTTTTPKRINIQYVKATPKNLTPENINKMDELHELLKEDIYKKFVVKVKKGTLTAGDATPSGAREDIENETLRMIRLLSTPGTQERVEFFGVIGDAPTEKQQKKLEMVRANLVDLSNVLSKTADRTEAERLLEFGPGARVERVRAQQEALMAAAGGAEEEKEGEAPAGAEPGRMEGEAGAERPRRRDPPPEPGRMEGEAGAERPRRRDPPPEPGRMEGEAGAEEEAERRQEALRAVRFEELEGAPPPPPVPGTEPGRMEGEAGAEAEAGAAAERPRRRRTTPGAGVIGGESSGGPTGGEGFPAGMAAAAGPAGMAAAGPAVSAGGPPSSAGGVMSEDDAKKALKQNPDAPGVDIGLIGPDSAKEQKEKGIIYKEQFNIVFSDRSGVRALNKFEESEEGKEGMRKTPDKLFMEAEDIRKTYEDQLRLSRLVYSQADNKKDLVKQWNELNVLKAGVIQNLTSGKSSDPLKNYDSIGVVVDVSSLGMSLQDFLNYVQQKGLTPESENQANNGNYRLTGLKKPLNLDDVQPEEDTDEEEGEGPPVPKQATEDPAQKMEVLGRAEVITNERVKGRVVSGLFKKPKEQAKTQRIRVVL